jgi:hypothetical protein
MLLDVAKRVGVSPIAAHPVRAAVDQKPAHISNKRIIHDRTMTSSNMDNKDGQHRVVRLMW